MKQKLALPAAIALLIAAAACAIGCNMVTTVAATRTASAPGGSVSTAIPGTLGFQGGVPTVTPLIIAGAQAVTTPIPTLNLTFVPTAAPTPEIIVPVVEPETQGAIEWVIAQIVIPTWNFLYTLVVNGVIALWVYAGDRGGLTAQVCGCILPILVLGFFFIRTTLRRIRAF